MYTMCVNMRSSYLFKWKRGFDSPNFAIYVECNNNVIPFNPLVVAN